MSGKHLLSESFHFRNAIFRLLLFSVHIACKYPTQCQHACAHARKGAAGHDSDLLLKTKRPWRFVTQWTQVKVAPLVLTGDTNVLT